MNGPLPLAGLRVIELLDGQAETFGRLLADLGADVLKVEPPGGGRSRAAAPLHDGVSLSFLTRNANKRSTEIDLTTAAGREQLLALAADADILVEPGPPGRLAALGLDLPVLRARNPQLVVTSITDFGQTGPYRDWAATDLVHLALNSVLSRSGLPGRPPVTPPGQLVSEVTAIQAVWAALVALWARLDTGHGDHVDFSVFEASVQSFDPPFGIGGTATISTVAEETSRDRPDAINRYPVFACADGYARVCVLTDRQWESMLDWLGRPAELTDPDWTFLRYRLERADFLHPYYADLVKGYTRDELTELGRVHGIPIEGLASPQEALTAAHFTARGVWTPVPLPGGRSGVMPNGFAEMNGSRLGVRTPAPPPGGPAGFSAPRPDFTGSSVAGSSVAGSPVAGSPAPGNRPGAAARTGPLRGLRVLDLGVVVVGAETSRLFADMGADVVKIESRRYPDGGRQTVGMTPAWAFGNRSRRSLGIDLRSPAGRELFLQLAARADAVFSNFKPGTMQRLGLDDAALRAANPDIVVVESSALGAWGPSSKNMGYGPLVRAVTGLSSVWRYPGEAAGFCDNITVYPDHTSARIGAVTALALLLQRRAGGHGGHAAIAQAEVILGQLAPYYLRDSLEPGSFRARGNTSESDAPAGVFPCAGDDEWCAVEVRGDDDWRRLCHAIGQPELARDPSLGSAAQRLANRDRLEHLLAQWLATRSPQAAAQTLQGHGVPAGMMLRPMELLDDPQLRARSFFRMLHQPETGDLPTEAGPALFGRIDPPVPRRAPRFGEHTREVVREWLGLDPATIEDLVKNGTLEE